MADVSKKHVIIYTDGAAKGNPTGPGGYGAVLQYTDRFGKLHEKELSAGYDVTTNNRMELMGVIAALECLNGACNVDVYSDSQYVVKAFTEGWIDGWRARGWKTAAKQPVKNVALWERLLKAMEAHDVTFHWVKGHAGQEINERCDRLASAAAESSEALLHDDGGDLI